MFFKSIFFKKKNDENTLIQTEQHIENTEPSLFYKDIVRIATENRYKGITKETIADFKDKIYKTIRTEAERGGCFVRLTYDQMYDMMPGDLSVACKNDIACQVLTKIADEGFSLNVPNCDSSEHWVEISWMY